ncbi:MAG: tetratricopeptide repeat protein, partial [Dehalococcoidia bacterium]
VHEASRLVSKEFGANPESEATVHGMIGGSYVLLGEYDPAERHFRRALQIQEALYGRDHAAVLKSCADLGTIQQYRGRYAEAEELLRRGIERSGAAHLNASLARNILTLAWCLHDQKKLLEAEAMFGRALDVQHSLGIESDVTASAMTGLGVGQYYTGRLAEAEKTLRDGLVLRLRRSDTNPTGVAFTRNFLGVLLIDKGEYDEAEQLFQSSLDLTRKVLGEEHPLQEQSLVNLTSLRYAVGDTKTADRLALQNVALRSRLLAKDNPALARMLADFAQRLKRGQDGRMADFALNQLLKIGRLAEGYQNPHVATGMLNLGCLAQANGAPRLAITLLNEGIRLRLAMTSRLHLSIADPLIRLGRATLTQGDAQGAEKLLREALSIRAGALGADHWLTVLARGELGRCLVAQGRFEEAEPLIMNAFKVAGDRRSRFPRIAQAAGQNVVRFFDAWAAAEPGTGHDAQATAWRAKLEQSPRPAVATETSQDKR